MLAVLRYLEDERVIGMVRINGEGGGEEGNHVIGQMTVEEEGRTFWELEPDFEWRPLL